MTALTSFAPGLWTAGAPQTFLGWHLRTRMTVVQLDGGGVWLHSPIPLTETLREEVAGIGDVRWVVAPTNFHHLHVGPWLEAWPDAELYGAPALPKKRKELTFAGVFGAGDDAPWKDDFAQVHHGALNKAVAETTFLHRASETLITTDLVVNLPPPSDWWTKQYRWICGVPWNTPTCSRPIRLTWKSRASIDRLLQWDFDRATIAHGENLPEGAHQALEEAYRFLK